MNQFLTSKVILACDAYLPNANTLTDKAGIKQARDLQAYAKALWSDGTIRVYLSIEDFAPIAGYYAELV